MKPYHEQRNAKMRRDYERSMARKKRAEVKNAQSEVLEELRVRYSSWQLSIETIRLICTNDNYGKMNRSYRVAYVERETLREDRLASEDGKVLTWPKKEDALKAGKKILRAMKIKAKKIVAELVEEKTEEKIS